MGWWRRMRNKFKKRKATARPTRYMGHGDAYGDPSQDRDPALPSAPRTTAAAAAAPAVDSEKALIEAEERFSMSMFDRPSMMSDRDSSRFEEMSFELPRR